MFLFCHLSFFKPLYQLIMADEPICIVFILFEGFFKYFQPLVRNPGLWFKQRKSRALKIFNDEIFFFTKHPFFIEFYSFPSVCNGRYNFLGLDMKYPDT